MFDSSWGLGIFSMSHARDKTKTYHLSYTIYLNLYFYLFETEGKLDGANWIMNEFPP